MKISDNDSDKDDDVLVKPSKNPLSKNENTTAMGNDDNEDENNCIAF